MILTSSCRFILVLCFSNRLIFFTMQLMQIRMLICLPSFRSFADTSSLFLNKTAPTAAFSLPCLEIRSSNEEAINFSRNRIYSLKVFYFLLYRRRYFLLVSELISARFSDDRKYVYGQTIRMYKCTNIQGLPFQRNYIIARDQKCDLHGASWPV